MHETAVPAPPQPWRTAICSTAFAVLFAVLVWRLHDLQIEHADRFAALGERQRERKWKVQASRGSILDRDGLAIVDSEAVWNLYADPDYMNDKLTATVALAPILGIPRDQLREHFQARSNGRLIAKHLSEQQATAIKALMEDYREQHEGAYLGGLTLRRTFRRVQRHGAIAPHVVGFVLDDGTGAAGIEQALDEHLRGRDGLETLAVDALGRPLIGDGYSRIPAQHGAHVRLTLSADIQHQLERALVEAVAHHEAASAAGVVIEPTTGAIVAMASVPTFDVADFRNADPRAFRNNVIGFPYASGSTMKPLVAGAVVADGLAEWDERIDCEHGTWHCRGRAKPVTSAHPHGLLSVLDGIAKSDNVLMAKLGVRMGRQVGPDRLHAWIRRFGFGAPTGIELPGEEHGLVRPARLWDIYNSCISVSMGYELLVTPLQMACAHAAVANGGVWKPPYVIDAAFVEEPGGGRRDIDLDLERPRSRRLFAPEDAEAIAEAMRETMRSGTGRRVALDGFSSAGKTGTTVKFIDGAYDDDRHIGSFVCWAPADPGIDPAYLCLVVIDDPRRNGHYGSQTAAPVVQRVLQFALDRHLGRPQAGLAEGSRR